MIDFYTWTTPNGRKVSILLEELGVDYEVHSINITQGDQNSPAFLKISPNNKIPAIIDRDNGMSLMESGAILIYLAEKYGKFLPKDSIARAEVNEWLMWYDHAFWTGPLDGFFEHQFGRLGYRSLRFEEFRERGDWLGCAVMNFGNEAIPYTRITEHKHLSPWESHDASVLFAETAIDCGPNDVPYYPMRRLDQRELLARYVQAAEATTNTTFVGRLGTYRYIDMDVTIREAMDTAASFLAAKSNGTRPPVFSVRPL